MAFAWAKLSDAPPTSEKITDYDEAHFPAYMFLLDWSAAGVNWCDTMIELMGDEVLSDPARAKSIYDTNLARAQWFTHTGWRLLLRGKPS
jgi:hypothetical protein